MVRSSNASSECQNAISIIKVQKVQNYKSLKDSKYWENRLAKPNWTHENAKYDLKFSKWYSKWCISKIKKVKNVQKRCKIFKKNERDIQNFKSWENQKSGKTQQERMKMLNEIEIIQNGIQNKNVQK